MKVKRFYFNIYFVSHIPTQLINNKYHFSFIKKKIKTTNKYLTIETTDIVYNDNKYLL